MYPSRPPWYCTLGSRHGSPQGKVVFLAPTRPLVQQQVDACHRFMGVAKASMVEITGTVKRNTRRDDWLADHKRFFFCTPQSFNNDVESGARRACLRTALVKHTVVIAYAITPLLA